MATLQSTFPTTFPVGVAGMRANTEPENVISRTVESAAGIAFGQPAFRGSDDHGCIVGATQAGSASATAGAGNTGNGAMGAITVSAAARAGNYTLQITDVDANAGEFAVYYPDGTLVGTGDVAAAFSGGGLAFTLADGSTDFVVGDYFIIAVTLTANAALLGIVVMDRNVPALAATPDAVPQYKTASILNEGVVWVTAGATVADGDQAYWNPATSRYTNTSTHVVMPGCYFDTSGVNGDLVRLAIRKRINPTL